MVRTVLVDGIEQSMQNVNPADVASISVCWGDARSRDLWCPCRLWCGIWLAPKVEIRKSKVEQLVLVLLSVPQMMNSLSLAYYNNALYDAGASVSGINRILRLGYRKIKGFMQNPYSFSEFRE